MEAKPKLGARMHTLGNAAIRTVLVAMGIALPVGLLLSPAWARHEHNDHDCCRIAEPQPQLEKTFKVSGTPELAIDNITGPIHVIGDSSGEIRLSAAETVRGDSDEDVARAKREVHLDFAQNGNSVAACVNGPFRHSSKSDNGACQNSDVEDHDRSYSVLFDFELHVPSTTKVRLNTVNEGAVKVERLSGGFELRNVNGGIELDQASGAGDAKTVNGDINATFAANPGADSSFSTVNGAVHMYFRPNLAAKLRYKTLNGDVYTDFAITPSADAQNGEISFRRGRSSTGQVGSGGPEIDINTLNGNIFIHRAS
jgi:hypothetical protein